MRVYYSDVVYDDVETSLSAVSDDDELKFSVKYIEGVHCLVQ